MRYDEGVTTKRAPAPKARRRLTSASELARREAADNTLTELDALSSYLDAVASSDRPIRAEKTMALTYVRLGMGDE